MKPYGRDQSEVSVTGTAARRRGELSVEARSRSRSSRGTGRPAAASRVSASSRLRHDLSIASPIPCSPGSTWCSMPSIAREMTRVLECALSPNAWGTGALGGSRRNPFRTSGSGMQAGEPPRAARVPWLVGEATWRSVVSRVRGALLVEEAGGATVGVPASPGERCAGARRRRVRVPAHAQPPLLRQGGRRSGLDQRRQAILGPQGSGILCGQRDLVASALLQNVDQGLFFEQWRPPSPLFAGPNSGNLRGPAGTDSPSARRSHGREGRRRFLRPRAVHPVKGIEKSGDSPYLPDRPARCRVRRSNCRAALDLLNPPSRSHHDKELCPYGYREDESLRAEPRVPECNRRWRHASGRRDCLRSHSRGLGRTRARGLARSARHRSEPRAGDRFFACGPRIALRATRTFCEAPSRRWNGNGEASRIRGSSRGSKGGWKASNVLNERGRLEPDGFRTAGSRWFESGFVH